MFYGVYGRNGAVVYYNWDKVQKSQPFIDGMRVKKFKTLKEALEYIRSGLVDVYEVIPDERLDIEELYNSRNFFFHISHLIHKP